MKRRQVTWVDDLEGNDLLWGTCVHEAGHKAVAGALGGAARSRITGRGSGWTQTKRLNKVATAVVALAGAEAERYAHERGDYGDESDIMTAHQLLRRASVSVPQARRWARRLVKSNRRQIRRLAGRLWRTGAA